VVYRCAYNHKRGKSICSNDVQLRQDVLDSAILHALNDAIDERVLEASVVSALNRIRAERLIPGSTPEDSTRAVVD